MPDGGQHGHLPLYLSSLNIADTLMPITVPSRSGDDVGQIAHFFDASTKAVVGQEGEQSSIILNGTKSF